MTGPVSLDLATVRALNDRADAWWQATYPDSPSTDATNWRARFLAWLDSEVER